MAVACPKAVRRSLGIVMLVIAASMSPAHAAESASPSILLAERYHGDIDVTRYWVSEKLDGVRAHWDGKNLQF